MQGLIPRSFIDELLMRVDLVELIDSYIPLKKRGASHLACCPFHNEKTPSFNVSQKKQFYHCFGCGASGNAISFMMNYLNLSFPNAIETIAAKVGMQVPREATPDHVKKNMSLHQVLQRVAESYQLNLKQAESVAIAYLKQRGVNGTIAKRYQLGYAKQEWHQLETTFKSQKQELLATGMLIEKDDGKTYDRYRHRIMFPIHDSLGRIIGFGGRALDADQKPKYLNSPETVLFQKNRELYGLYQIINSNSKPKRIVVVEGYLDVLALAQHGIDYAVATLGTATSIYHIQRLSKHTQHITFCFDGDSAGRQAAWRALESSLSQLDSGFTVDFVFLPEGDDPDSLIRVEGQALFEQRLEAAIPLHQFFFDTLLKDIDHSQLSGKSQLVNKSKSYLQKVPQGAYKALFINELARLSHIENHRLEQILSESSPVVPAEKSSKTIKRTPLRIALALLLQHPELAELCNKPIQDLLEQNKKYHLLHSVITQIKTQPQSSTASLTEHWRDTAWFDVIVRLATWDTMIPAESLSKEFVDILQFIHKKVHQSTIEQLIEKSKQTSLSPEERQTLQRMLQDRHKPTTPLQTLNT